MPSLRLVLGPNPIFRKLSEKVETVDTEIIAFCNQLQELLYREAAVGAAAPMVGVSKRIVVYDLQENNQRNPQAMINPQIIWSSDQIQTFEEGSVCFPGISAEITRPNAIKVEFLDKKGVQRCLVAEGYLATVIQHEIDYLDGRLFLDYLSPVRRKMLLKKCKKFTRET